MNKIELSIIIPVYYNEGSISLTYSTLKNKILNNFPNLLYEIIFIDDGSKDNSYKEMCEVKENNDDVKLIKLTKNFGQVAAFYAGYTYSQGNGILNIAADLQEPPELIISMIKSFINKEAMIIAGKRIERDESYYRTKTSQIFYNMMRKLSFSNMPNGGFDIVLLDKKVKNFILDSKEANPFWQGQILWSGYSIKFIPYNRLKREIGKSKWSFSKKMKYLLDGILNYSYAPLRFFSVVGIISFFLGLLYAFIILISYFLGKSPFNGWAPLMIIILVFSGLQLMVTGLIGEYLWRTFEQSKNRPKFLVNETRM